MKTPIWRAAVMEDDRDGCSTMARVWKDGPEPPVTKLFYLYGSESDDIEEMRRLLEATLGISFAPHEGYFSGEYYLWGRMYEESLILQPNSELDDDGPVPAEPDFQEAQLLLYVNCPSNPQEIRDALASISDRIRLLRVNEV